MARDTTAAQTNIQAQMERGDWGAPAALSAGCTTVAQAEVVLLTAQASPQEMPPPPSPTTCPKCGRADHARWCPYR